MATKTPFRLVGGPYDGTEGTLEPVDADELCSCDCDHEFPVGASTYLANLSLPRRRGKVEMRFSHEHVCEQCGEAADVFPLLGRVARWEWKSCPACTMDSLAPERREALRAVLGEFFVGDGLPSLGQADVIWDAVGRLFDEWEEVDDE